MRVLSGIWKRKINGETLDYYPCPFLPGDIFITTNSIKPEIRYPGTQWEELPEETYLVVASDVHQVKTIFGENEHTLTVDEIPEHKHSLGVGSGYSTGINSFFGYGSSYKGSLYTGDKGGGQAHNNMPRSYAVYIYRRIA